MHATTQLHRPASQRRPAPDQFRQRAPRCAPHRVRLLQAVEVAASVPGGDRPAAPAIRFRRTGYAARRSWVGASPRRSGYRSSRIPPEGGRRGGGGGSGGGRGGGGGFFGGGNSSRGRLQLSLTDTITFVDKVRITPGGPELDYLNGDAAGSSGGTPRHNVQAQGGWSNNGLGARVTANWRSGTTVTTLNGDDLHFSPYGTFDLRLFANPGDIPEVAVKHPWLGHPVPARGQQRLQQPPTSQRCCGGRADQLPAGPARAAWADDHDQLQEAVPALPRDDPPFVSGRPAPRDADALIPLARILCLSAVR